MKFKPSVTLLAAVFPAVCSSHAATIANWKVLVPSVASGGSPVAGANTDSPVFGGGTNQMDAAQTAGRFGTVGTPETANLLVGETLTVTATITLTGGLDVTNNYRFGVFNDGGQFAANSPNTWTGGWLHSTGSGLYQGNTGGSFVSTVGTAPNNAVALTQIPTTNTGTIDGTSIATYLWTMTITRDSATTVDVFSSFVGGDGLYDNSYTANNVTTALFSYTAVGVLTSGNTDLDQLTISNAQYSVVPEPSSAMLGGLGLLALLRRRRH